MKLSIVIPCYNEEANIPLLLEGFKKVIGRRDMEVILVNNGSTDNSAGVMEKLVPKYGFARIVTVPVNKGYGYGIRRGLEAAKGEFIGWTHGDMQTDPGDVARAYGIVSKREKGPVYVKGLRRGRPFTDWFFTCGMSLFESIYFRTAMWDINGQPNIFPRKFYEGWIGPPCDFSLDLYALYMAGRKGLKVVRMPVRFPERINGCSKWNTGLRAKWKFIRRTVSYSAELRRSIKGKKSGGRGN